MAYYEGFSDAMRQDVSDVFVKRDDFAEVITLDGKTLAAIVERPGYAYGAVADNRLGVSYETVIVRIDSACLLDDGNGNMLKNPYLPGKKVMFNGKVWYVDECDGEDMISLTLSRERQ